MQSAQGAAQGACKCSQVQVGGAHDLAINLAIVGAGSQFVPSAPSPPRWLLVALACCFINNSRSDALVA